MWPQNIEFYPYDLVNKKDQTESLGALLKIHWENVGIGYSDFFPLVSFGEAPLAQMLEFVRLNAKNPEKWPLPFRMAIKAGFFELNHRQVAIQAGAANIYNHYHWNFEFTDELSIERAIQQLLQKGFSTVKLKLKSGFSSAHGLLLQRLLHAPLKLRLDFNSKGDLNELNSYLHTLKPDQIEKIEFIEDPTPFDLTQWSLINAVVPLALDFEKDNLQMKDLINQEFTKSFDYLILKPMRENTVTWTKLALEHGKKVVVTSILESIVGQSLALRFASDIYNNQGLSPQVCGCFSHQVFQDFPFCQNTNLAQSSLDYSFDKMQDNLKDLQWQKLI